MNLDNQLSIQNFIEKWRVALISKDLNLLISLYSYDAILIPHDNNHFRQDHTEILSYFAGGERFGDYGLCRLPLVDIHFQKINIVQHESKVLVGFSLQLKKGFEFSGNMVFELKGEKISYQSISFEKNISQIYNHNL